MPFLPIECRSAEPEAGPEAGPEAEPEQKKALRHVAGLFGIVRPAKTWVLAFCLTVLGVALLLAAVGPVFMVLFRERQLAEHVRLLSEEPVVARASDSELRRRVQTRARELHFYVAYEDVFVQFPPDKKQTFVLPLRLGYTLPLNLPFFGILEVPVLAVRTFDVKASSLQETRDTPAERTLEAPQH